MNPSTPTPRRRPRMKAASTASSPFNNKNRIKLSQRSILRLLLLIACTLYVVPHYVFWKKTIRLRAATTAQQKNADPSHDPRRPAVAAEAITKSEPNQKQPQETQQLRLVAWHEEGKALVRHGVPRISDNKQEIAAEGDSNVVPVGEFPFYRGRQNNIYRFNQSRQLQQPSVSNTTIPPATDTSLLSHGVVKQHTCHDGTGWVTMHQAPDFIIAGTQKGGTTALYALLRKHPQIVPSSLFEAHFFDMHYGSLREQLEKQNIHGERLHCQLRKAYVERLALESLLMEKVRNSTQLMTTFGSNYINESMQNDAKPTLLTFEKTPNYMIWPHVPAAIVETCPWQPKVIVILRNPVDRLYSQYQMQFVMRKDVPNLETVLEQELVMMRKFGLSHAPPPPNATTASSGTNVTNDALPPTQALTHTFRPPSIGSKKRDAKDSIRFRGFGNHGSYHRYLQRGMYIYQLQRFLAQRPNLELLVVPYERLRNDTEAVWHEILDFVGAEPYNLTPAALRATYRPSIDHDNRHEMPPAAPLDNATRAYLVEFYRPYNSLLADLLGEQWRGIWDV